MITQSFDINLIPDSAPVVVHCDQYDHGTGRYIATLYNGSLTYTPGAGATAIIQGMKPDRHGFIYAATISGNKVTFDLTEQMSACDGMVACQIVVTETDGRTGSFVFFLAVQRSALPADSDMSTSDYQLVEDLIITAESINTNPPKIGVNGNWWIWDVPTMAYVDSGVDASITVDIADITILSPDATPYVTNTGTDTDPVFHLFIPRGQTGATGPAAGFGTPTASVDANVGTPSVDINASGPDTAKVFNFQFHNLKGATGDTGATGAAAGFGTITASVDANVGTPSVEVQTSGPDTAKNINLLFHNLKGETGTNANAVHWNERKGYVTKNLFKNIGVGTNGQGQTVIVNNAVSTDMIEVNEGDTFIISKTLAFTGSMNNGIVRGYDANQDFSSSIDSFGYNQLSKTVVIPSGIKYIIVTQFFDESNITQTDINNHGVMFMYSSNDTIYEPYIKSNIELGDIEALSLSIPSSMTSKISLNANSKVYRQGNVVTGTIRVSILDTLSLGSDICDLGGVKPKNITYAAGINNTNGAVMPIIINTFGRINLFGSFIPTVNNDLIIPISFICE